MNAVRSSTGWSRRPLGEDGHAGATRSRVFRSGQSPDRICSGGAGVVGKAGGCRVRVVSGAWGVRGRAAFARLR
jgi:hypothetical protein